MSTFTTPVVLHATTLPAGTVAPGVLASMHELVIPIGSAELDLAYLDGRNYRVLVAFDFASQTLERIVHVPAGFVTDFASIPRALWNLLPPTGKYGKAALVHDELYRTPEQRCTRAEADRTFLEACVALRVSFWTCAVMYLGVRVGGGASFRARVVA